MRYLLLFLVSLSSIQSIAGDLLLSTNPDLKVEATKIIGAEVEQRLDEAGALKYSLGIWTDVVQGQRAVCFISPDVANAAGYTLGQLQSLIVTSPNYLQVSCEGVGVKYGIQDRRVYARSLRVAAYTSELLKTK